MSTYKEWFPSRYQKAEDLGTSRPVVTIKSIDTESVGSGKDQADKPVVYFAEPKIKPMVLNKVNSETIAEISGTDDPEQWPGVRIQLFASRTEFGGKRVPCVRVCPPPPNASTRTVPTKATAPKAKAEAATADIDEDAPADDDGFGF